MDSGRCRAWKLRNSSELWRPRNHHSRSCEDTHTIRGNVSALQRSVDSSVMMRSNEKPQAQWNSSTCLSQDTSSLHVGSKSTSPILRCRTTSPDLRRPHSADSVGFSASAVGTKCNGNVISNKVEALGQIEVPVLSQTKAVALLSSSTAAVDDEITAKANKKGRKQLRSLRSVSARQIRAACKGLGSRPASASPQMWQEKIPPVCKTKTDRSVVACKRAQSPNVAVALGTRTQKKKEKDSKNKCLPQSLDVFFVPGVQVPSYRNMSRSYVGSKVQTFTVDKLLLPSAEDMKDVHNGLVLCSSGALSTRIPISKKSSACVHDGAVLQGTGVLAVSTLNSPEDCVLMSINMAFEPRVKPMTYENPACLTECGKSTVLTLEEKPMPSAPNNCGPLTLEKEVDNDKTKAKCPKDWDETTNENLQVMPIAEHELSKDNCSVVGTSSYFAGSDIDIETSNRPRRWPKFLSTSDYHCLDKSLTRTEDSVASSCLDECEAFESKGTDNGAMSSMQSPTPISVSVTVESSQASAHEESSSPPKSTRTSGELTVHQKTGEIQEEFFLETEPHSETRPAELKSKPSKLKSQVGSSYGVHEELVPSTPTRIESGSKQNVSKCKRSLERTTLDKIEKKRRDENSRIASSSPPIKKKESGGMTNCLQGACFTTAGGQTEPDDITAVREVNMKRTQVSDRDTSEPTTSEGSTAGPQSNASLKQASRASTTNHLLSNDQTADLLRASVAVEAWTDYSSKIVKEKLASPKPRISLLSGTDPETEIDEDKLPFNDRPKMWTNPLHQENEPTDRASLSSEKFSSILSYLGHVGESDIQNNFKLFQKREIAQVALKGRQSPCTVLEQEDNVSLANSTFTTSLTNLSSNRSGGAELGVTSATSLFEGVRKKMQEFKSKIAAKESQNAELNREIERLKADKDQVLCLERDKFGRELEVRAAEYKAAIQHHLSLNEKMIKDKEAISEKCCNLTSILGTTESKYEDKMKVLKDQFAQELKKQKEIWMAGERTRRETWKEKKLKEIKELTIKGLEPHIDGLNEKHKLEIKRLDTRFADETQKKLELQSIQHRQETCELRNRLLKERDEILEKERLAALTRLNDVAEKYEYQAMDLRRKVSSEMATELERLEETRRKEKLQYQDKLLNIQEEWKEKEMVLKGSLEKGIEEAVAQRDAEIRFLRSEVQAFKQDWQKELDKKLRQALQIKEEELKSQQIKERDEQIEMIIERMEIEKDEAISQSQHELLAKVETLMENKLELMRKLKEVESKCANLCKVSLEAKEKAETEAANKDLQIESLHRENLCQLDLIKQLKAQILSGKNTLKEQEERYEQQFTKEQELKKAAQVEAERSNAETQLLRLRKAKELEEVEVRVRQAIENKDQIIAGLREQLLTAREQIRHTELLLQQEQIVYLADPD